MKGQHDQFMGGGAEGEMGLSDWNDEVMGERSFRLPWSKASNMGMKIETE